MEGHDAVVVTSFLQLGDAFRPVLIGFEAKIINHGDVRPQYLELLRRLGAAGYRWQWSWPNIFALHAASLPAELTRRMQGGGSIGS